MPSYTPPLRDMQFVMHEMLGVVDELQVAAAPCRHRCRHDQRGDRGGRQVRERGAGAAQRDRRRRGLHPRQGDARGQAADRLQGRLRAVRRRRLAGAQLRSGVRRPGPAAHRQPVHVRDDELGEPGLDDVPGPLARRLRVPAHPRHRRAEEALPRQADQRPLDRHDVPDRAAVRHRPRPAAHQGRAAGRRQLPAHRQQDLHLRRRARHGGEHRPPGAGAPARRAGGLEGHLAVRGAEVEGEGRRLARRAQRHLVRRPRAQDGHPRQRHRADRPRERRGHAGRRAEQGPAGDVRDDERGPPRRRHAVASA